MRLGHHGAVTHPRAGRARGARHGPRQRRGQDHQEPPQDAGIDARPAVGEDGRCGRRISGTRRGRHRAACRRRRRDHAVDQSGRDPGEQDHQRGEVPQRDHRRPIAQGAEYRGAAARLRARRVCKNRRARGSGAGAAGAGDQGRNVRADASGRSGRGDGIAGKRARGIRERDAGVRRRCGQRRQHRRRRRRCRTGGGADRPFENVRQCDELLVGKQRDHRRCAVRRDAGCTGQGRWHARHRRGKDSAAIHDVAWGQAQPGGHRTIIGADSGARGAHARRLRRQPLSHGRGIRSRARRSVLGREIVAGACRLSRTRLQRGAREGARHLCLPGRWTLGRLSWA